MSRTGTRDAIEHERLTARQACAKTTGQTAYVSQVRIMHQDKAVTDWADSCGGHTDYQGAHECAALEEAIINAEAKPGDMIGALKASMADFNRKQGAIYQHRVIKRAWTMEETVVEGEGAEAML